IDRVRPGPGQVQQLQVRSRWQIPVPIHRHHCIGARQRPLERQAILGIHRLDVPWRIQELGDEAQSAVVIDIFDQQSQGGFAGTCPLSCNRMPLGCARAQPVIYGAMRYGTAVPTRYGGVMRLETKARSPARTSSTPRSLRRLTRPRPTLSCRPSPTVAANAPLSASRIATAVVARKRPPGSLPMAPIKKRARPRYKVKKAVSRPAATPP